MLSGEIDIEGIEAWMEEQGRSEELRKAVSDQNYREHLYAEAGLA